MGGSETAPLNLWRVVHITEQKDESLIERFGRLQDPARAPEYITIYFERVLGIEIRPQGGP